MKGFSYLLCVIGKLNVKLYELINNYPTDVCFQFQPINSMSNNVSHNKTINYPVHRQIRLFGTPGMCHFLKIGWLSPLSSYNPLHFTALRYTS